MLDIVKRLLKSLPGAKLEGQLWIVDPKRIELGNSVESAAVEILWAEYADFEETPEMVEIVQQLDVTSVVGGG